MDRSQFDQILTNLIVNARDAMPNGGETAIEVVGTDIGPSAADRSSLSAGAYLRRLPAA